MEFFTPINNVFGIRINKYFGRFTVCELYVEGELTDKENIPECFKEILFLIENFREREKVFNKNISNVNSYDRKYIYNNNKIINIKKTYDIIEKKLNEEYSHIDGLYLIEFNREVYFNDFSRYKLRFVTSRENEIYKETERLITRAKLEEL
ncbi:hypothetical protein Bp8pS_109 [Bacillus phage vB_BpuM-BpSp]|nr:hypothetical protein Bp8pS_109 [Bacillus phage vB_BpuM-BpSp]